MSDQKECQDLVTEEVFLKKLFSLYKKNQEVLLSLQYFFLLFENSENEDLSSRSLEKAHALMTKNLESITKIIKNPIKDKELPVWRELLFNIFDEMFTYYQEIFVYFDKALEVGVKDELAKKAPITT